MDLETHNDGNAYSIEEDNIDIDAEVDLEAELICSLNGIERLRNKK
jgi:hypothetical protein